MLIYIVKTFDTRYYYLFEFLKTKVDCVYSNSSFTLGNIDILVLPLDGIDEFGYIKHTNLKLENFIKNNNIKEIFTGKINTKLLNTCELNKIKLSSFYDDLNYCSNEFLIKLDVIKVFVEEKLNTRFSELKTIVIGNDYKAYLISEQLNADIYDRGSVSKKSIKDFLWNNYDVIINCTNYDYSICNDKIIIEMNELDNIDMHILLNSKKVFFINQLISQYLTKSGGKILYDTMVKR